MVGREEWTARLTAPPRPSVNEIQAGLEACLRRHEQGVRVTAVEALFGGYETYIYRVQLAATRPSLHLPVDTPLILRLGWRPDATPAMAWEALAMDAARRAGIPAPEVYHNEPGSPGIGPFLLMEQVRGKRFDQAALDAGITGSLRMIRAFARAQAAIYRVSWRPQPAAMPSLGGSMLAPFASREERLAALRLEIDARHMPYLAPALGWLEEHRTVLRQTRPVFMHGDCHPFNVFIEKGRISGIIDWSAAGFGDRHEDIGWSSMLIATATSEDPAEEKQLALFRSVGRRLYLAFLYEACRLDRDALRYGEVYGALRWLLIFLPTYLPDAGPPILNADAVAFTTPRYVQRVRSFLEQRTGLRLSLPDRGELEPGQSR